MSDTPSLFEIPLIRIDGSTASLADYRSRVLLIVNVASKCGFTPQYDGLEELYRRYQPRGLSVLGFPSNDFGAQEPGGEEEIADFCRSVYGVDFPMFAKITVKGIDKHPLYGALTAAIPVPTFSPESQMFKRMQAAGRVAGPEVIWNFEKFLIGRHGDVLDRFGPDVAPGDALLVDAVEGALSA